jgi:hypothetical protein
MIKYLTTLIIISILFSVNKKKGEKTMNNSEMVKKVLNSKIYDYAEGKAIFVNDTKVFLDEEMCEFLENLENVDAEYDFSIKGIEIEIDDETLLFEEKETFRKGDDGRDHRYIEYDFSAMKSFVEKYI